MANPDKLTVSALAGNAFIERPAGDTIDTDGVVPVAAADFNGASDRLIFEVTNLDGTNGLIVTVASGDYPPAARASLGDLVVNVDASGVVIIGPLESARFMQDDGTLRIGFESDGGANASATVRTVLLPKAV